MVLNNDNTVTLFYTDFLNDGALMILWYCIQDIRDLTATTKTSKSKILALTLVEFLRIII